jgi:type IV secretion system protein VirB8
VKADRELEPYFAEAASWDADRAAQHRRSARMAWGVAGAGWIAAVTASVALMLLMPLKHVEPFVIRVDNTTGITDVVPVYAGKTEIAETVTRYLLAHYVSVCERFNYATAESDYEECGSFHNAQRNQVWYAAWNPSNPASPLNLYKDGTIVRAQVKSVSFFRRASGVADLAQVRYLKAKRAAGGADELVTHWIATIQYAYADPSADPKTRRWNPLGFKITDFRPEPEVLPDTPPPSGALASSVVSRSSGSREHTP